MLTQEQIEQRRSLITASEAAAVLGINKWHSPLDVYLEKMGESEQRRESWRSKRGNAIEPLILASVSEQLGMPLKACSTELRIHPTLSWLGASPDALALANETPVAVIDAKEIGVRMARDWQDDEGEFAAPDYVYVQVAVQMAVTGIKIGFAAPWLPDDEEPRVLRCDHDPELEATILEELERFRKNHILRRIAPPARTEEEHRKMLARLFPRAMSKKYVEASLEQAEVMRSYIAARTDEGTSEMKKEHAGNLLRAWIGEQEGIAGFGVIATWKDQDGKIDWQAYAKALGGNEVDAERHRRNGTRVLRVNEMKTTKALKSA